MEVLIYGDINEWSAREFFETIAKQEGDDITVRINSNGGSVDYGWGMITKFSEMTGKKLMKNDGKAYSMGAFAFLYADDSEAIDTAEFMFHRCGLPDWMEADPNWFTAEDRARLERKNKSLRKAFEAKIKLDEWAKVTDVTVDQLFSMDGRPEVFITATQAKKIGLINRTIPITPTKKKEISAKLEEITAKYSGKQPAAQNTDNKPQPQNKKVMDLNTLKTEHPTVYAAAVAEGEAKGKTAELERIAGWNFFAEVDPKAVKEGIASGKAIDQATIFELMEKKMSKKTVADLETDSEEEALATDEKPKASQKEAEAKAKLAADFVKKVEANSNYLSKK